MFVVKRSLHNPLLVPYHEHQFESSAVFNMSVVKKGKKYVGLYRAISSHDPLQNPGERSIIGKTESSDGIHFDKRTQFIQPEEAWEKYGCEDPRVTHFEGNYYIFYTALGGYPFGPDNIKTAVAISKDLKKVDSRHLVTPFNSKAMTLFPERINGKITFLITLDPDSNHSHVAIGYADSISDLWSAEFWKKWQSEIDRHTIPLRRNDYDHVEIGAAPIKTKDGWLLVYSYIQNYFPNPDHVTATFGVEAALLDMKNPHMLTARTRDSILSPEELYERRGLVSEIVFPTGAFVETDILHIYYGGADNVICRASVDLSDLIQTMKIRSTQSLFVRSLYNPIISPIPSHPWESLAAFNPGAFAHKGVTYILYRAMSEDNTSTIGLALSTDNVTIEERLPVPIYVPREDFEMKKKENGNSGCEDPRVMLIKDTLYMCYTAYDGVHAPRVAVTSISLKDFLNRNFTWKKPFIVSPEGVDDKDASIFPKKIDSQWLFLHRIGSDICADYVKTLDFEKERVDTCISILSPRVGMWDSAKVGISAPPIETKHGWLLIYHGVSKRHNVYRVGALLLDLHDPTLVLARSTDPIFEPIEIYEKEGIVPNVVFPCGAVVTRDMLTLYYGGGDKVVGVATCHLSKILDPLVRGSKLK